MRTAFSFRLALLPVVLVGTLGACDQNPFDARQVPTVTVSTAAAPVISWTPAGARYVRVYEGAFTQDGLAPIAWDVIGAADARNALQGPLTYGVVPPTGRENVPARALVPGRLYTVEVFRDDPEGSGEGFSNTRNRYAGTATFTAR